jgi:hypothetical protein
VQFPVAYIGGLVKRYQAGEFIAAKAHRERECRRLADERRTAVRAQEAEFARQLSASGASPVSSSETARQTLAVLREGLRRQWARSGGKDD